MEHNVTGNQSTNTVRTWEGTAGDNYGMASTGDMAGKHSVRLHVWLPGTAQLWYCGTVNRQQYARGTASRGSQRYTYTWYTTEEQQLRERHSQGENSNWLT